MKPYMIFQLIPLKEVEETLEAWKKKKKTRKEKEEDDDEHEDENDPH